MAFTDTQCRQLKAKLDARHVKTRSGNGNTLHYVEGWHVIAEANRIFGFDAWDRRTLATRCVWTGMRGKQYATAYTSRVRIRVRAGETVIVREGSGTGEGKGPTPGEAHEIALKSAETDATKRALATFGNPFGLALYDRELAGVRYPSTKPLPQQISKGPWILRCATGDRIATLSKPSSFIEALRRSMSSAANIEALFAVWEKNVATVRALNYCLKQKQSGNTDLGKDLVAHLKNCAVALVNPSLPPDGEKINSGTAKGNGRNRQPRAKIDKTPSPLERPNACAQKSI
jgi:hypothetical protein